MNPIADDLAVQIRAIREELVMRKLAITLFAGGLLLVAILARNLNLGSSLLSLIHI